MGLYNNKNNNNNNNSNNICIFITILTNDIDREGCIVQYHITHYILHTEIFHLSYPTELTILAPLKYESFLSDLLSKLTHYKLETNLQYKEMIQGLNSPQSKRMINAVFLVILILIECIESSFLYFR